MRTTSSTPVVGCPPVTCTISPTAPHKTSASSLGSRKPGTRFVCANGLAVPPRRRSVWRWCASAPAAAATPVVATTTLRGNLPGRLSFKFGPDPPGSAPLLCGGGGIMLMLLCALSGDEFAG